MTVATEKGSIIIKRPLLKRGKYYVKARNNECVSCLNGNFGCCRNPIDIEKLDFQIDFTSEEDIHSLLDTGVFCISVELRPECERYNESYASIRIKQRDGDKFGGLCAFWSESGCRLPHATRPKLCRRYICGGIKDPIIRNKSTERTTAYKLKQRYIWEFTKQEVRTMAKVLLERKENNRYVSEAEYKHLDWDSILSVL